jgi:hypothetical protein
MRGGAEENKVGRYPCGVTVTIDKDEPTTVWRCIGPPSEMIVRQFLHQVQKAKTRDLIAKGTWQ